MDCPFSPFLAPTYTPPDSPDVALRVKEQLPVVAAVTTREKVDKEFPEDIDDNKDPHQSICMVFGQEGLQFALYCEREYECEAGKKMVDPQT